jgi:N-formylglutamate amidohydrolase
MQGSALWTVTYGEGPVIAVAIHAGHALRPEIAERMRLSEEERLREEDPYTSIWTSIAATRIVAHRSRFEVDLNRPREGAVYESPEQSWGLDVWKGSLASGVIDRSLAIRERFYGMLHALLEDVKARYGRFVVYDLHSYNHRRDGPDGPVADPAGNPDVNVGTGTMDRARWSSLVEGFMRDMRAFDPGGCALDVRENVRFKGGHLSRFVHETFPEHGCALAIEFKKTFMDEWTGQPDEARIAKLGAALAATVPGVVQALNR